MVLAMIQLENGCPLVTNECGTLFYDLPMLNKLCHAPVQNSALSILSSLLCAIFHPSIFLSAANPDSELLLWWYSSRYGMVFSTKSFIGSSMKSEREAYDRAMKLLSSIGMEMDSIRLDRYYSSPSYMDKLGNTKVFIIPKKNSTLKGSRKWKDTMKDFVENTMSYLEEYHQRSNSESGFAADKKMLGWNIAQRRDDRIDNALFCTGAWHNLFNMGRS